ncbi:MAG TPA: DUF177 domain-containing protein [Myxococcota bacterium]|jgi:uncharacterized protein|nr:DUF177 domain-containing protein [Myxococcota bacterium]
MKLLVDRIQETPSRYDFEAEPAFWSALQAAVPEVSRVRADEFRVDMHVYRSGSELFLSGTIHGALELECGRCLARYRAALHEPFRLVLEPAGDRVPAEPESAAALERDGLCLLDELETGWFRGKEIELGPYFIELVQLAVPVQPLCREDCRGLCPRCGVDRNQETCHCEAQSPSSPFAVLSALRGAKSEGES